MTTFTTDTKTPDNGTFPNSIHTTQGVYVRRNYADDRLELWLDGSRVMSKVNANNMDDVAVGTMLQEVKRHYAKKGRDIVRAKIREALGF